ncbi:MAG: SDR family oxidoreductase [Solirubrobacterales bacterium]
MESNSKRIAVAGATGRVGSHTVAVLTERGHDVVSISRSTGVDVVTGEGLAEALDGVEVVIDTATGASPDRDAATEFFETATRNLQRAGERAGVGRIVVVSIIATDRFAGGYGLAKQAHERAMLAGPVPAQILRAAQFHEFVPELIGWGRQGDISYVPRMRTQVVAAQKVAEALADLAVGADGDVSNDPIPEIAGPRVESLIEIARLYAERVGDPERVEEGGDPDDPDAELNANGGLLPSEHALLAGPTFADWLDSKRPV